VIRAHLELCRLYSPSRLNEPVLARQHGEWLLTRSQRMQNRVAKTQALWCLSDVLREGAEAERVRARQDAEQALNIMREMRRPFGIARGENYVANIALLAERDAARAVPLLQRTLDSARDVGFVLLESRTLMNLGVAYDMLGQRSKALNAYRESFKMSETLRDAQDAARSLANAAAILVDYGEQEEGLRDAQNAVGVFHELGDKNFEAHARRVIGSYYRHVGQYDEARLQLNQGLAVAQERKIGEQIARLTLELGRAHFDAGDYIKARELFMRARTAPGVDGVQAHTELARTYARLGDFGSSRAELEIASSDVERFKDVGSLPLLNLALGELEYETDRVDAARKFFGEASNAWSDGDLPEDASVEARAYSGWLTVLAGEAVKGTSAIMQSLRHARATGRLGIEARCLVFLARGAILRRDFEAAVLTLGELPEQRQALLNPELRAQIRYWRGEALGRKGEGRAAVERAAARTLLESWLANVVGASYQSSVRLRPVIRLMSESDSAAGR
jgi:tetratricopeptide (TPR) repeat protein